MGKGIRFQNPSFTTGDEGGTAAEIKDSKGLEWIIAFGRVSDASVSGLFSITQN